MEKGGSGAPSAAVLVHLLREQVDRFSVSDDERRVERVFTLQQRLTCCVKKKNILGCCLEINA